MPEVLDNPVVKDNELDSLRDSAVQADRAEFDGPSANETEQRAPVTPETEVTTEQGTSTSPEITPEKPKETEAARVERERDELGRFKPKGDTPIGEVTPKAETLKVEPTKPETPYELAKREGKEREARAWQKIEAEKADIARQRTELQRSMEQRNEPARDQGQYTAEDYDKAAEEFSAAGDPDLAARARDAAKGMRLTEQRVAQERGIKQFQDTYYRDAQSVIESEPDVVKHDSPIYKKMAETFALASEVTGIPDVLWKIPGGYKLAHGYAKSQLEAGMVSGLEEDNKKLKAEVERLNGLTRIDGSGPTSPSAPKNLDNMSSDEAMEHLRQRARSADQMQVA